MQFLQDHKFQRFTSKELRYAINKLRVKNKEKVLGRASFTNNLKQLVNHGLISWDTATYEERGQRIMRYTYWIQTGDEQFNPLPSDTIIPDKSKKGFKGFIKKLLK